MQESRAAIFYRIIVPIGVSILLVLFSGDISLGEDKNQSDAHVLVSKDRGAICVDVFAVSSRFSGAEWLIYRLGEKNPVRTGVWGPKQSHLLFTDYYHGEKVKYVLIFKGSGYEYVYESNELEISKGNESREMLMFILGSSMSLILATLGFVMSPVIETIREQHAQWKRNMADFESSVISICDDAVNLRTLTLTEYLSSSFRRSISVFSDKSGILGIYDRIVQLIDNQESFGYSEMKALGNSLLQDSRKVILDERRLHRVFRK